MNSTSIVEPGGINPRETEVIIASLLHIIFWDPVSRMGLEINPVASTEQSPRVQVDELGRRQDKEGLVWRRVITLAGSLRKQAMRDSRT